MNELIIKAFDFGIRLIELANYLDEEKKYFPLIPRLLECGTGISVYLQVSDSFPKSMQENCMQSYKLTVETEYLLELMAKTGVINEIQSKPILSDCRYIKEETRKLLGKNRDKQQHKIPSDRFQGEQ
mgnify:CR=1 FL=1